MSSSELRIAMRRALNEWGSTEERCKQLLREVNEQMAIAEAAGSVHAQIMTGMPHGSGVSDPASTDDESGLRHYKHMACNMAFICDMMARKEDNGR